MSELLGRMEKRNLLKSATIRNARSCAESENFAYYVSFDTERDFKGWDFAENVSLHGVSNGIHFLSSNGEAPSLSRATSLSNIDASLNTELVIRYKYKKNRNDSIATLAKVQFITSADNLYNDDKSITFDLIADDEWHTYYLNMGAVASWVGFITNLKIFFSINGRKDDEIFLSYIKIQKDQFVFCTEDCYVNTSETALGINFDSQEIGAAPQNFSISNTSISKVVSIKADPENSLNKVMSLNKSSSGTAGPTASSFLLFSVLNGFLSCRFRVSALGGEIRLETNLLSAQSGLVFRINNTGKLAYKTGLVYVEFTPLHSIQVNTWYDLLVNFSADSGVATVYLNDILLGTDVPYLDIAPIEAISFDIPTTSIQEFFIDDVLLVEQDSSNTNCVGIGKQGELTGLPVLFTQLSISAGINDSLICNINDFGDVVITLPENSGYDLDTLRATLEHQITQIDLGGYVNAEVLFTDGAFKIRSGTYGFDSQVVIKQHLNSSLAEELGFLLNGEEVGTVTFGRPHAQNFKFSNGFRASTSALNSLVNESTNRLKLIHNPKKPAVEIGSSTYDRLGKKNSISGSNKTFIDYQHRATAEGNITSVIFQGRLPGSPTVKVTGNLAQASGNQFNTGILDLQQYGVLSGDVLVINEPGYLGNGSYTIETQGRGGLLLLKDSIALPPGINLDFSIHNIPKVKHFRPKKDGSLVLINESSIGLQTSGQLYTRAPDSHKISVNWYVHRGDLIGIYNPIRVFTGNDPNASADAVYLQYDGDLIDAANVKTLKGQGIRGIGLYGKGDDLQRRAVYDLQFDGKQTIEYIEIKGKQLVQDIEYNLLAAVNNGVSVTATVTGTHIHETEDTNGLIQNITHNNVAYNVASLTDGVDLPSNGFLGTFQTNVAGASYFYISGDGEFAGYNDAEGNAVQSLEFPFPGPNLHLDIIDYEADPFNITFSWSAKKTVHRYKMFFKEYPNADGYSLEYKTLDGSVSDGTLTGYELIGSGSNIEYSKVSLDTLVLIDDTLPDTDAYKRHFNKTFIGFAGAGNIQDASAMQALREYPYTVLNKEFTPVETQALNWRCIYHKSTKISEIQVFSKTSSEKNIKEAMELYFAVEDNYFQRVVGEQIDEDTVRFYINFPTKYIRLVIDPGQELYLDRAFAVTSDDNIRYKNFATGRPIDSIDVAIEKGQFSNPYHLRIQNKTGSAADLQLAVDVDELYKDILIKTSLHSEEEVINPEIGPPGFLIQDSDYDLPTVDNVAINAKAFGLKNLAAFKPYYVSDTYENESDYFINNIDVINNWDKIYSQFPQTGPSNLGELFPGFSIDVPGGGAVQPNTAQPTISAELRSRWKTLGSFTAVIAAIHDARGSLASALGSEVGLVDSTGRKLLIRKSRTQFTQASSTNQVGRYVVLDGGTILDQIVYYCQNQASVCPGGTITGNNDDLSEYNLFITRIKTDTQDLLRFSYIDTANGTGNSQWGPAEYYEINLATLSVPLVGDIKIFIRNFWTRASAPASANGTPGSQGSFVRINYFNFGGPSTYANKSYIFTSSGNTGISGSLGENNKHITLASVTEGKYVALDLGNRYNIDLFDIYSHTNKPLWNKANAQYSNTDVSDPANVIWGNSTLSDCRWILFSDTAVAYNAVTGLKYLDYIRVYPDITTIPASEFTNSVWEELGTIVTDNNKSTYINQVDYPVFALRLANQFEVSNFQLLNRNLIEYARNGNSSNMFSWTDGNGLCDFTVSHNVSDDPHFVLDWDAWQMYADANKPVKPIKWLAFKCPAFNISNGGGTKYYVSEVKVSTKGESSDDIGQVNDRIDFTEYSEWYNVDFSYQVNVAEIPESLSTFVGSIYDAAPLTKILGENVSEVIYAFDGDANTALTLNANNSQPYIWRVFGTPVLTSGSGNTTTITGNNTFVISGSEDNSFTISYYQQTVDAVQITVPDNAPGIPNSVSILAFSGTDPTNSGHWTTIYSEGSLATTTTVDGQDELQFNSGSPLIIEFDPPITVSGLKLIITDVEFLRTEDEVVTISEFKVMQTFDQNTAVIATVEEDASVRVGGRNSLKISYLAGNSASVKITAGGAFNIKPDPNWSIQDYLFFHIKAENLELLDLDNCYIKIGETPNSSYKWKLSQISETIGTNELAENKLKFLYADDRALGSINVMDPDRADLESTVDFINGPLTFFELELKPKTTASSGITVWLDNFNIQRENFTLSGVGPALYLNNSELLYYPMTSFDIRKGYFEAVLTPDWSILGQLSVKQDTVFTIFAALNGDNESFSCFYDSRTGLVFTATAEEVKTYMQAGFISQLENYKPFKLSVAWDSEGKTIDANAGTTLRIWLDDKFAGDFNTAWTIKQTKDVYFFIGSRANQSEVAINTLQNYPTTVPIKIVPTTESLNGGIENLVLSSDPKQVFFDEIKTLRDKIFISIDGINYYSGTDPALPFLLYNIAAGDYVDVWVKTNLPQNTDNMQRQGFLKAKWRIIQ